MCNSDLFQEQCHPVEGSQAAILDSRLIPNSAQVIDGRSASIKVTQFFLCASEFSSANGPCSHLMGCFNGSVSNNRWKIRGPATDSTFKEQKNDISWLVVK